MQKLLEVAAGLSIPPNLSETEIGQILDALGLKVDDTITTRYWRVERNSDGAIVKREPLSADEIPMEATSTTNTSSDLVTEVPATPQNSVSVTFIQDGRVSFCLAYAPPPSSGCDRV